VAGALKTTPDKIKINLQLLGGGFGRRIWPDAPVQAAVIASIVKKPVKLILTREDDIAAARPRPMTHHVLKAGLDDKGNLSGWYHRIVAENVDSVAAPPRFQATGGKDLIGWRGMEQEFYTIPNIRAEGVREQRGMRVHAWRGIGAGYNKFVSESFVDEIAAARGVDPLAMRLELTKNHPRASAVIKAVAEMADWKRKRPGRGLGLAFADYHVLRMSDVPAIHTRIIASNNPPTGMGEIGLPSVAPAIGNAVFQLTGKRLRHLPMSPTRVKTALA